MKKKNKRRFLQAEDLCRLNVITSVAISPDERKVAYTVENVSADKKKYFSKIFLADTKTGESRQFTFGEVSDCGLVWSPDGKYIAFISTRNKKTGIYVISSEGGAEKKIIEEDGSFSNLVWIPDGKELVYVFRYNDSHKEKDEKKKKESPLYRHITRLLYRVDLSNFLPADRYHIWKVDIETGKTKQLTKGKYDEYCPAVSPDGKWIVFVSNRSKDPDLYRARWDLFIIPAGGGKERKIPTPAGPVVVPTFSPDGKRMAYIGHTNPYDTWGVTNSHVWTVGVGGKPAAKDLIPKFDRQAEDQTIGDMGEGEYIQPLYWSPDGKRIYFVASDTGSTHAFYVSPKGGQPTRITKKNCHVKYYSMGGRRKFFAAVVSDPTNPGELYLIPAVHNGDSKAEKLTTLNKDLFSKIVFPSTKEVRFKAHDGIRLQGWLVTPPNFSKNKKYPAILEIHGGPRMQYGFTFFHEMLFLASKGYIVFYTNPRGSSGRGETFADAITGNWGESDYPDSMDATDYLEGLPFVNKNRMGVTGGSYGGFMTNWIIGHTNRFKAAVTQRSVVNIESMVGSTYAGYIVTQEFGGYPWQKPEIYKKCSPLTYASNIKTPLLIIHSEQDFLNIEQAEQLFVALKLMKKKVEFVRFPEESHGLSRHGRPDRRIARLEWILKWFDKYLK